MHMGVRKTNEPEAPFDLIPTDPEPSIHPSTFTVTVTSPLPPRLSVSARHSSLPIIITPQKPHPKTKASLASASRQPNLRRFLSIFGLRCCAFPNSSTTTHFICRGLTQNSPTSPTVPYAHCSPLCSPLHQSYQIQQCPYRYIIFIFTCRFYSNCTVLDLSSLSPLV